MSNHEKRLTLEEILHLKADLQHYRDQGVTERQEKLLLKDVQANIIKASRHRYSLFCFLTFKKNMEKEAVRWLEKLPITSAWEQREELKGDESVFNLFLSFYGYEYFCDEEKIKRLIPVDDDNILAFREGLQERCPKAFKKDKKDILQSSDQIPFDKNYLSQPHALIIISLNDPAMEGLNNLPETKKKREALLEIMFNQLAQKSEKVKSLLEDYFFEIGLRNPESNYGAPREWFGYKDGISNPRFFNRAGLAEELGYDPDEPSSLSTILRRNALSPKPYATGSFVVFLKLKEDIAAFNKLIDDLSEKMELEEYKGYAAAYLMGRHKDGTPLAEGFTHPTRERKNLNRFDFKNDPDGRKCPLHAHIRKARPRDGYDYPRILRRGRIYGPTDSNIKRDKGLLFLSFQRNLEAFESIVNSGLYAYNNRRKNTGKDIFALDSKSYQVSHKYVNKYGHLMNFYVRPERRLVEFMGGYYFFASSISFIRKNLRNCM